MADPKRTLQQNRIMHGQAGEIARRSGGGADEAKLMLGELAKEVSGQEHTSQLTERQAARVIALLSQRLSEMDRSSPTPPRASSKPEAPKDGPITARQVEVLDAMFEQLGMSALQPRVAFCRRTIKKPRPLDQRDVDVLMTALKAMVVRQTDPAEAWQRLRALNGHPKLDAWQRVTFVPDLLRRFEEAAAKGDLSRVLTPHRIAKLEEAEAACGVAVEAHHANA